MEVHNLVNEAVNNHGEYYEIKLIRQLLRDASNPFEVPENYFLLYYRMKKHVVINLIDLLQGRIARQRQSIPAHLIVLSMLRFFAHGSFQRDFSNNFNHPMGQSTSSRYLNLFIQAMMEHAPTSLPSENEETFFNYKYGPALNVQIIVDCNSIIRSLRIVPGSNNDQFNWNFSTAKEKMELLRNNAQIVEEEGFYYILGDSGYARSHTLLTPIVDAPERTPESVYTQEHVHTRCKVEQTIGTLSGIWKAISRSRKLYYGPRKAAMIINTAAILHNFRKLHGEPDNNLNAIPENGRINFQFQNGIVEMQRILNLYY